MGMEEHQRVDRAQQRLDELDSRRDERVGLDAREAAEMTDVYLARVDALQERVATLGHGSEELDFTVMDRVADFLERVNEANYGRLKEDFSAFVEEQTRLVEGMERVRSVPPEFDRLVSSLGYGHEVAGDYYAVYQRTPSSRRLSMDALNRKFTDLEAVLDRIERVSGVSPLPQASGIMAEAFSLLVNGDTAGFKARMDKLNLEEGFHRSQEAMDKNKGLQREVTALTAKVSRFDLAIEETRRDVADLQASNPYWRDRQDERIEVQLAQLRRLEFKREDVGQKLKSKQEQMVENNAVIFRFQYRFGVASGAPQNETDRLLLDMSQALGDKMPADLKDNVAGARERMMASGTLSAFERAYYSGDASALKLAVDAYHGTPLGERTQEQEQQVVRALETNPDLKKIREVSSVIYGKMGPVMDLLYVKGEGGALQHVTEEGAMTSSYVFELKRRVQALSDVYNPAELKSFLINARKSLAPLKSIGGGKGASEFETLIGGVTGSLDQLETLLNEGQIEALEAMVLTDSFHKESLGEWLKRDGVVLAFAIVGGMATAGLATGWAVAGLGLTRGGYAALVVSSGFMAAGGVVGGEVGREASDLVFGTDMESNLKRCFEGKVSVDDLLAGYGKEFVVGWASSMLFMVAGKAFLQGVAHTAESSVAYASRGAQGIQKIAGSVKDFAARVTPPVPGGPLAQTFLQFSSEVGEEIAEGVAQDMHPALGVGVQFWNSLDGRNLEASTDASIGIAQVSQVVKGRDVESEFEYARGNRDALMAHLKRTYPNMQVADINDDGVIWAGIEATFAGKKNVHNLKFSPTDESTVMRQTLRRSVKPGEALSTSVLTQKYGVKLGRPPASYTYDSLTGGRMDRGLIPHLKADGYIIVSITEHGSFTARKGEATVMFQPTKALSDRDRVMAEAERSGRPAETSPAETRVELGEVLSVQGSPGLMELQAFLNRDDLVSRLGEVRSAPIQAQLDALQRDIEKDAKKLLKPYLEQAAMQSLGETDLGAARSRGREWGDALRSVTRVTLPISGQGEQEVDLEAAEQWAREQVSDAYEARLRELQFSLDAAREDSLPTVESLRAELRSKANDPRLQAALGVWGQSPNLGGEHGNEGAGFNAGVVHYFEYRLDADKSRRYQQESPSAFSIEGFIAYSERMGAYLDHPETHPDVTQYAFIGDAEGQRRVYIETKNDGILIGFQKAGQAMRLVSVVRGSQTLEARIQRELSDTSNTMERFNSLGSERRLLRGALTSPDLQAQLDDRLAHLPDNYSSVLQDYVRYFERNPDDDDMFHRLGRLAHNPYLDADVALANYPGWSAQDFQALLQDLGRPPETLSNPFEGYVGHLESMLAFDNIRPSDLQAILNDPEALNGAFESLLINKRDQIERAYGELDDADALLPIESKLGRVLGLDPAQPLTADQKRGLLMAHFVGIDEGRHIPAFDGDPEGYTTADIAAKARLLEGAGFTREQRRILIEELQLAGVLGRLRAVFSPTSDASARVESAEPTVDYAAQIASLMGEYPRFYATHPSIGFALVNDYSDPALRLRALQELTACIRLDETYNDVLGQQTSSLPESQIPGILSQYEALIMVVQSQGVILSSPELRNYRAKVLRDAKDSRRHFIQRLDRASFQSRADADNSILSRHLPDRELGAQLSLPSAARLREIAAYDERTALEKLIMYEANLDLMRTAQQLPRRHPDRYRVDPRALPTDYDDALHHEYTSRADEAGQSFFLGAAIENVEGQLQALRERMLQLGVDPEQALADYRMNPEHKEYDEVWRMTDVFYVPDIHGDVVAMKASLQEAGYIDSRGAWIGGHRVLVFSGDYVDRGPASLQVLDYLMTLQADAQGQGGRVEMLVGNHETLMMRALLNPNDKAASFNWITNGGSDTLQEAIQRYPGHPKPLDALRHDLFDPDGRYESLIRSWKVFTQVDDVLYVHAGITPTWSAALRQYGVHGMNELFQRALREAAAGDFTKLDRFDAKSASRSMGQSRGEAGPLWADFDSDLSAMSDADVKRVASDLKAMGINAIVVGHTEVNTPQMAENFARFGIKLIGSDVGMSSGYRGADGPGKGGVRVGRSGDISGYNNEGPATELYHQP